MTQTPSGTQDIVDRASFIKAMRNVANSVTVVTTNGEAGCHGGTVSAFCSVSADPPTVLVCLMDSSRIAQTTLQNGNFCVNVLPYASQHVADRFAGRHDNEVADRPLYTEGTEKVAFGSNAEWTTQAGTDKIKPYRIRCSSGITKVHLRSQGTKCRLAIMKMRLLRPKQSTILPAEKV